MTVRSVDWAARLPPGLLEEVRDEILRFLGELPDNVGCLITGSLVEGIGNSHSDIDLYVVQTAAAAVARPDSIGIRKSRYLDCEHLTDQSIRQLSGMLEDESVHTLLSLSGRDFDRYYRLAIGIPVRVPSSLRELLDRCDKQRACTRYADWCTLRAYESFARAAVAHAERKSPQALVWLREAALWRASSVLAADGEGYPSLKWTEVKAARRYGAGSAAYRRCLDGYVGDIDGLPGDLARMRDRIAHPTEALAAMSARDWRMAPAARLFVDGTAHYLVLGGTSITRLTGVPTALVAALAAGASWRTAVARVAADLHISADEVVAASSRALRELTAAGFLTPGAEGEGEG